MKNKIHVFIILVAILFLPAVHLGQSPNLGILKDFVLFSSSGAVSNTGISTITGNVGTASGALTGFEGISGNTHNGDAVALECVPKLLEVYNFLNSQTNTAVHIPVLGDGEVLGAGVYAIGSAGSLNDTLTLTGNENSIFIFKIGGAFSTSPLAYVKLINGVQACNVFWKVEGAVSIASGTKIKGTMVANNGAISFAAGSVLDGRAFSTSGPIAVDQVTAGIPLACLIFYYPIAGAADISILSNWTNVEEGIAGTIPQNFTSDLQRFNINRDAILAGNLIFAGGSDVAINSATLTVTAAGRLSIGTGSVGNFKNNPVLLQSNATGTASIGTISGSLINATNTSAERYIPATGRKFRLLAPATIGTQTIKDSWQWGTFITSNVPNAVAQGFDAVSPNPSMLVWDNSVTSTNSWYNRILPSTNLAISAEPGYMIFIRGDKTALPGNSIINATKLVSTGNLHIGDKTVQVAGGTTTGARRYTLVGNPYASSIDFDMIYNNPATNGVKRLFWIWDATLSGTGGYKLIQHRQQNTYYAIPAPFTDEGSVTDLKYIQSGQAFFVEPAVAGVDGQVSFEENNKVMTSPAMNIFEEGWDSEIESLRINVSQVNAGIAQLSDGVMAAYHANWLNGLNANDVVKFTTFNENLAIASNGKRLISSGKPLVNDSDTIFLQLWNTTARNYELSFKPENFRSSALSAFLYDGFLGTSSPVSLSDITRVPFTVTNDAASKNIDRFYVYYKLSNVLPVSFKEIVAHAINQDIQVAWQVATESKIKNYEVERSADRVVFTKVASINTVSNYNAAASYTWLDVKPFSGNNFYRIKATDLGGKENYSSIVAVKIIASDESITVFPNPVQGNIINLQFNNQRSGLYTIQLLSATGQQVFITEINHPGGTASRSFTVKNALQKGIYHLRIVHKNNNHTIIETLILK